MEAARAVQRGLVTPDRTVLIASSHRVYSMNEKIAATDGRVDSVPLIEACTLAARRYVSFDMNEMADAHGAVFSAVLFGALCGSQALLRTFTRDRRSKPPCARVAWALTR